MSNPVMHMPTIPPETITFDPDPDTVTPLFAAGPTREGEPKKIQLLQFTYALLTVIAVPLVMNVQLLKPYELVATPIQFTPTRKLNTRTFSKTDKLPAERVTPVAKGAKD